MQDTRGRSRGRRRAAQSDAIVIALTAQVIVCVVLLLAAVLLKKNDTERYGAVRQEYDGLAADEDNIDLTGVFQSLERWIGEMTGRTEATVDENGAPLNEPIEILPEEEEPASQPTFDTS